MTEEELLEAKNKFLSRIKILDNGCWAYISPRSGNPVHESYVIKPKDLVHRVAYKLFKGSISSGFLIMYTCDHGTYTRFKHPVCCNPDHLVMGTHKDNMQDAKDKGKFIYTEEHKKLISEKLIGNKNCLGRVITNKTKEKMRKAHEHYCWNCKHFKVHPECLTVHFTSTCSEFTPS